LPYICLQKGRNFNAEGEFPFLTVQDPDWLLVFKAFWLA